MQTARAPNASALTTSVPRRKSESTSTGMRPSTASRISGSASMVERPLSSARPPWLDTTMPSSPLSTASTASSAVISPFSISRVFTVSRRRVMNSQARLEAVGASTIGLGDRSWPNSSMRRSSVSTSTRRRGRSWNFWKPSRLARSGHLVVDAGRHVAEMRRRHVLVHHRLEVEDVERLARRVDQLVERARRPRPIGSGRRWTPARRPRAWRAADWRPGIAGTGGGSAKLTATASPPSRSSCR